MIAAGTLIVGSFSRREARPKRGRATTSGVLTDIQYRILKRISPGGPDSSGGCVYQGKSKLAILMGAEFFAKIAGKVVIDFGCGKVTEAVEMAGRGARRVIGIDIRDDVLEAARQKAVRAGVQDGCVFVFSTKELADWVHGRLMAYCTPVEFRFVDDLPRTALGKVQHFMLRQTYVPAQGDAS